MRHRGLTRLSERAAISSRATAVDGEAIRGATSRAGTRKDPSVFPDPQVVMARRVVKVVVVMVGIAEQGSTWERDAS